MSLSTACDSFKSDVLLQCIKLHVLKCAMKYKNITHEYLNPLCVLSCRDNHNANKYE